MSGVHALLLQRQGLMQDELAHLRKTLQEDLAVKTTTSTPSTP
jgi:hypothetical protein